MNLTIRQNLTNMALSQYQGLFFDRGFASVGGKRYALKCDALCLIDGCTDQGKGIQAEVQSGTIAFGDGEKRIRSVQVKGFFEGKNSLSVTYGMDTATPVTLCTQSHTLSIGSGGGGSLKFNGVRSQKGEHGIFNIKNVLGRKFLINSIKSFMVRGSRR